MKNSRNHKALVYTLLISRYRKANDRFVYWHFKETPSLAKIIEQYFRQLEKEYVTIKNYSKLSKQLTKIEKLLFYIKLNT